MCCGSVRLTVVVELVFMVNLEELLGDRHADFEVQNSVEKTS